MVIKVVSIIDEYNLVINSGKSNGVYENQEFLIYGVGEEIIDPDTGESLGNLEVVKGKAKVIHVQDSMATLISDDFEFVTETEKQGHFVSPFQNSKTERKVRIRLPFKSPKVGNFVKQIHNF